jgi:hypothetical protein
MPPCPAAAAHHHGVLVLHALGAAVVAHIKVCAHGTAQPSARLDFHMAEVAGGGEGGGLGVVQVVQHHHAAVLGATQGVKLRAVGSSRQNGVSVWAKNSNSGMLGWDECACPGSTKCMTL